MKTKLYDPLAFVPSPQVVRDKLAQTEELARKLRVLLDFAERIDAPESRAATTPPGKAVSRG